MNKKLYNEVLESCKKLQASGIKVRDGTFGGVEINSFGVFEVSQDVKCCCAISAYLVGKKRAIIDNIAYVSNFAALTKSKVEEVLSFIAGFDGYTIDIDENPEWFNAGSRMRKQLSVK